MSVRLLVATRTDVGRVRAGNEDALIVADELRLVAVADGMGGHQGGEVASATAIDALLDGLQQGEAIDGAITAANDAVVTRAAADQSLRGMGTTLTAGILDGSTILIGHVGDSRAYLLRGGALHQLTTDHSVVAELIAAGELTEAEALVDPRRSMITRALGIDATVEVDVLEVDLVPGDRLLLCSDGLTTMVRDAAIAQILASVDDRQRAADELVDAANLAGGADNITVVVADVVADDETPVTAEAGAILGTTDPTDPTDPATDAVGEAGRAPEADEIAVADEADEADTVAVADEAAEPDHDLEELRTAVEESTPPRRRRWWRRRTR